MLLDRPYRQGLDWERAVAQLRAGAGGQFDPALPSLRAESRDKGLDQRRVS
jgi:HD-GYP domain-containing protein (c-di-GMP phosphodiesterase class II)